MYDRNNWVQVWLGMPGTGIQAASLFWFRIKTHSLTFPLGTVLAHDAADFFASVVGFTTNTYQHSYYLHAYIKTNDLGPIVQTHGFGAWPLAVPPVTWLPSLSWHVVSNLDLAGQKIERSRFTLPAVQLEVDGNRSNAIGKNRIETAGAIFAGGFASQGRVFQPVSVSYKNKDWQDVAGWSCGDLLGGRRRRQSKRRDRLIGNIPKNLP